MEQNMCQRCRKAYTALATELDRIKIENEDLIERLGEAPEHCKAARLESCPWWKIGEELKAERDRLRNALKEIRKAHSDHHHDRHSDVQILNYMDDIARKALKANDVV